MLNQKPKRYETITISFTEADEDIVEYVQDLKKSHKASEFIREAIREKINRKELNNENNEEIISELQRIEERISLIEKNIPDKTNIDYEMNRTIQEEKTENRIEEKKKENIDEIKFDNKIGVNDNLENALDFFDF